MAGRAIPIVVGVGDIKNKSTKLEDALEPMELMFQAITHALNDAGLSADATSNLRSRIDSLDVVATWTWPYPDLPSLLADRLGATAQHKSYSPHGGNQPAKLFDEAARRISFRNSKVAVVTGGEALASLSACAAAQKLPPPGWTKLDRDISSVFSPSTRELGDSLGAIHSIGNPIHIYPLYENGFRAHRGQSISENNKESAKLYADFAEVAERNPLAWNYGKPAESEESIGTVTKRNRLICFPYPLLMNAFNIVNLASACLLTSTEYAKELGIPENKWIYPLGGAGTSESDDFWERTNFYSSPAISKSLDAGLEASSLKKEEIDLFDFYSCFPIVPKLACAHLQIPITGSSSSKPITLLGGLTSFGGAGNNYSMHALTEMVRQLRNRPRRSNGLVLANGGSLTYQYVTCLSSQPRRDARGTSSCYPAKNPLPEKLTETDVSTPQVEKLAQGEAVVETYTVEFNRDGTPSLGHVVGRLRKNGRRFIANHGDASTLAQLASGLSESGKDEATEPIGRSGWVRAEREDEVEGDGEGRRNLFSFVRAGGEAKL